MVKKPTDKNTKAEILTAFNELLEEKKAVETQLTELANAKDKKSAAPIAIESKPVALEKTSMNGNGSKVAIAEQSHHKMEYTIESLGKFQLSFGGAVSELSEKLTLEASKLQDIEQLVSTEVEELEELHDLEIAEGTLDTLIEQYQQSSKTFAEEFSLRRETVEQERITVRKAWTKEQEQHQRAIKERNETQNKTRQRDTEEYTYNLQLQRKINTDEYEQTQKVLYKEIEEFQKEQEKRWAEREKTISDREKQFEEYKAKVEAFPKDLEAAVKKSKEQGRGLGLYQTKVKADLRAKEVEGEKRVYDQRILSFDETIQTQEARLQTLAKQLESALKQVQDLAVKAIEGASNVNSYQAVKEIAIEQAKTKTNNK